MYKLDTKSFTNLLHVNGATQQPGPEAPSRPAARPYGDGKSMGDPLTSMKNLGRSGFNHLMGMSKTQQMGKDLAEEAMKSAPVTLGKTMSKESIGELHRMMERSNVEGLFKAATNDGALRKTTTALESISNLPKFFRIQDKQVPPAIQYFSESAKNLLSADLKRGVTFQAMGTPDTFRNGPMETGFDPSQAIYIKQHMDRIAELGQQFAAYQKKPRSFEVPSEPMQVEKKGVISNPEMAPRSRIALNSPEEASAVETAATPPGTPRLAPSRQWSFDSTLVNPSISSASTASLASTSSSTLFSPRSNLSPTPSRTKTSYGNDAAPRPTLSFGPSRNGSSESMTTTQDRPEPTPKPAGFYGRRPRPASLDDRIARLAASSSAATSATPPAVAPATASQSDEAASSQQLGSAPEQSRVPRRRPVPPRSGT